MDVKAYYKRLREVEEEITDAFPVVASIDTADGGRDGEFTETPRWVAARMIAQGQARLATAEEASAYRRAQAEAAAKAEKQANAAKLQVAVLSQADFNKLKGGSGAFEG